MASLDITCRLCAKEDQYCIAVFGEDGQKNSISKKIRLCLPIAIREDDVYPKQICLSCLNKLDTSYELYSGCMGAQNIIKKLYNHLNSPVRDRVEPPKSPPIEQTNLIAREAKSLNKDNRMVRVNSTILQYWTNSKAREPEQPDTNVRIISTESLADQQILDDSRPENIDSGEEEDDDDGCDNFNMDVDIDDDDDDDVVSLEQQNTQIMQQTPSNLSESSQTAGASESQNSESMQRKPGSGNKQSVSLVNNQSPLKTPIQVSSTPSQVFIPNTILEQAQRMLSDTPHSQKNEKGQSKKRHNLENSNRKTVPVAKKNKKTVPGILKKRSKPIANSKGNSSLGGGTGKRKSLGKASVKSLTPQAAATTTAQSKSPGNTRGMNPVTGHGLRCRCKRCGQAKQSASDTATTSVTTAVRNSITSPVQESGLGLISNVRTSASEFSQMSSESENSAKTTVPLAVITPTTPAILSGTNATNTTPTTTNSIPPSTVESNSTSTNGVTEDSAGTGPAAASVSQSTEEITIPDSPPERNVESVHCNYCNKYFPADIYIHHKVLHFRSRFFCCVACGKNFRTEIGLQNHRCDAS